MIWDSANLDFVDDSLNQVLSLQRVLDLHQVFVGVAVDLNPAIKHLPQLVPRSYEVLHLWNFELLLEALRLLHEFHRSSFSVAFGLKLSCLEI